MNLIVKSYTYRNTSKQTKIYSDKLLPDFKSSKDTLIVFTTCNHLDMTVLALEYLIHSLDVANLVIVDDFSLDGTGNFHELNKTLYCIGSFISHHLLYIHSRISS
jgi:hypothetical protein